LLHIAFNVLQIEKKFVLQNLKVAVKVKAAAKMKCCCNKKKLLQKKVNIYCAHMMAGEVWTDPRVHGSHIVSLRFWK